MGTCIAREIGEIDRQDGLDRDPLSSEALRGFCLDREPEELYEAWLQGWDTATEEGEAPDESYHDGSGWRRCWHGYYRGECPACYPIHEHGHGREDIGY